MIWSIKPNRLQALGPQASKRPGSLMKKVVVGVISGYGRDLMAVPSTCRWRAFTPCPICASGSWNPPCIPLSAAIPCAVRDMKVAGLQPSVQHDPSLRGPQAFRLQPGGACGVLRACCIENSRDLLQVLGDGVPEPCTPKNLYPFHASPRP